MRVEEKNHLLINNTNSLFDITKKNKKYVSYVWPYVEYIYVYCIHNIEMPMGEIVETVRRYNIVYIVGRDL